MRGGKWRRKRPAGPLLLGCVMAYAVNIPMSLLERHFPGGKKLPRAVSIILALAAVAFVFVLAFWLVLPELTQCIQLLMEQLPGALVKAQAWFESNVSIDLSQWAGQISLPESQEEWQEIITKTVGFLTAGVGGAMEQW